MKNRPLSEQVNVIVSCFMAILYIGGGIFLITSSYSFGFFKPGTWQNTLLALLLIIYGVFRALRAWKTYRKISEE
jgi:hypothetical protein